MAIYKSHFSHGLLKKYSLVIGHLLDGIEVVRFKPDGTEDSRVPVPVQYAPKEKFIRNLVEDPDLTRKAAITLPKISYEMNGLQYSSERKLARNRTFAFRDASKGAMTVYAPVAYDIMYTAYVAAKTQEDMFQIIEQLVPAFAPDFTVTMRGINSPDISFDVPVTLDTIQPNDEYEGRFEDNRVIIWTLSFLLKGVLFGPVRKSGIIKHIDITMYDASELSKAAIDRQYIMDIDLEPFIDGVLLENIEATDPYTIKKEVTYGI